MTEKISSDHHWDYNNDGLSANCRICGLKAEYGIYDMTCYGGQPVEQYKWMYYILEDEDLEPGTCRDVMIDRACRFLKKPYYKLKSYINTLRGRK